jgi:hypothetical protein
MGDHPIKLVKARFRQRQEAAGGFLLKSKGAVINALRYSILGGVQAVSIETATPRGRNGGSRGCRRTLHAFEDAISMSFDQVLPP